MWWLLILWWHVSVQRYHLASKRMFIIKIRRSRGLNFIMEIPVAEKETMAWAVQDKRVIFLFEEYLRFLGIDNVEKLSKQYADILKLYADELKWCADIFHVFNSDMPSHDDVIKWKHFPRYWPFVRGIARSPVNSPHKGQWRGALKLSMSCVWINDWVNNREAGYLRRYHAHYGVIVMLQVLRFPSNL